MKIEDYTHEEKQQALDEAWGMMNPKTETDAENIREKLDYLNETQDFNPTNIEWLMRQAGRAKGMEKLLKLASHHVDTLQENKKLEDKLNYVKSLVESNRIGHAVKFELQMMFKGDEK